MSLRAEQAGFHFGPGPANTGIGLLVSQATIEFLALLFRERERLGLSGDAVPDIFNELDTLSDA